LLTMAMPRTQPARNARLFTRALAENSTRITAMMGTGLMAAPMANGSTSLMAAPMGPPHGRAWPDVVDSSLYRFLHGRVEPHRLGNEAGVGDLAGLQPGDHPQCEGRPGSRERATGGP